MGTVRRDGKWTLEKDREGVYAICERGELRARILTPDYEPQGIVDDVASNMMTETIEVRTFTEAEREFNDYIEQAESGDFGLF